MASEALARVGRQRTRARQLRAKLARLVTRMGAVVLFSVVLQIFMVDGRLNRDVLRKEVCDRVKADSMDTNPDCFSAVEETSTGWLIEVYSKGEAAASARVEGWAYCPSYILLPAENTWNRGVRGFLYLFALLYSFLGIAIVSDVFMASIETITSKKVKNAAGEEEDFWNPTVANLTLMALGSSAPEILLNVVGVGFSLDSAADPLGPSTIVGSASFNLLIISAVCVMAPVPDVRKIEGLDVFAVTAFTSVWAYIWLLIILQVHTPGEVDIWEALVTLFQFPLLVFVAWGQDIKWRFRCLSGGVVSPEEEAALGDQPQQHHTYLEYRRNACKMMEGATREDLSPADQEVVDQPPEFTANGMYSDPYCRVIIDGESKQTAWKKKRLNPIWKEKFVFDIDSSNPKHMTAKFEVYDRDELTKDDFLGEAEVDLNELTKSNTVEHQLKLVLPSDTSIDAGSIKVVMRLLSQAEESKWSVMIEVVEGRNLLAMDTPNKVLDAMATSIGRQLTRMKTMSTKGVLGAAYSKQLREAITPGGEADGDLTSLDCVMHFLTIFWKVLFALIPPPHLYGGWLSFVVCLIFIGALTAVVGEIAGLFGCTAGVSKSLTAITFVALGTSLPDTFASKVAAQQEETADAALGNITGSNAVNVFLGIGLPWTIAAVYWQVKCSIPFPASSIGFVEGVIIFSVCATICLAGLMARRFFLGAELGGTNKVANYGSSAVFIGLWLTYIGLFAYFEKNPIFTPEVGVTSIAHGCPVAD